MPDADIDLVVVNYRTRDLLTRFLDSLEKYTPDCSYTLTVVDVDPLDLWDRGIQFTYLATPKNVGYARACNLGAVVGRARNLALLNADTAFTNPHCLDRCVEFLDANPQVAVVGPLQVDSSNRVTHAGIFGDLAHPVERAFKSRDKKGHLREDRKAVSVTGSAFFTKRAIWDEMRSCPVFDAQFPEAHGAFLETPHYYEETGYAYHVQAHGYEVWYLGSAEMNHEWHQSSAVGSQAKHVNTSREIFRKFCDEHGIEHE